MNSGQETESGMASELQSMKEMLEELMDSKARQRDVEFEQAVNRHLDGSVVEGDSGEESVFELRGSS